MKKNELYSFINIFGLAIGLSTCLLILLWINDDLLSSLLALIVGLSTVTVHTARAALANPADSLKYE